MGDVYNYNIFDIQYNNRQLRAGAVLISNPLISDYFFKRSVVLIVDYNKDGALGIVLNKPIYFDINEVAKSLSVKPLPLFAGGPVSTDRIFFLHQLGDVVSNSFPLLEGIFWGGDEEDLSLYLKNPSFDEKKIRPFLGYAGWNPGQLEREIKEESWVVADGNKEMIFHPDIENLWKLSVAKLGPEFQVWLNFPIDPMAN